MNRPKQRGNLRAGLWQDLPGRGVVPADELPPEAETSPLTRPCPHCGAATGQRCTRPARNGRTELTGYHPSRTQPASNNHNPSKTETQENP